ncbi:hypothetical protein EXIGLDRAFT_140459 [Exidia glandulosa HHB12029]|uniref:Uncharacterized protein n=1 Tax=Exidia glandulosa HHB12029 TaxID=1314781 RepID=A0A166A8R4_EXIGL|nr:hypothetical protein EXIGLDRAFT_140459 [Exidia glandulosa HHB12029]
MIWTKSILSSTFDCGSGSDGYTPEEHGFILPHAFLRTVSHCGSCWKNLSREAFVRRYRVRFCPLTAASNLLRDHGRDIPRPSHVCVLLGCRLSFMGCRCLGLLLVGTMRSTKMMLRTSRAAWEFATRERKCGGGSFIPLRVLCAFFASFWKSRS